MSFIALEYFQRSPVLALPLVALALFMLVFLAVTVKTVLSGKTAYDSVSRMPLEDSHASAENPVKAKEARRGRE